MATPPLQQGLGAEFIGTALLLATVIGSGIMGERGGHEIDPAHRPQGPGSISCPKHRSRRLPSPFLDSIAPKRNNAIRHLGRRYQY